MARLYASSRMIRPNTATMPLMTSAGCSATKSRRRMLRGLMVFFSTRSSISSMEVYWTHLSRMANKRGSAWRETPMRNWLVYLPRGVAFSVA